MDILSAGFAPATGGSLSSTAFRMLDRAMDQLEQNGDAIIDMMDSMAVSQAQITGQGLNVDLAL